jgi:ribA/ribD-fused uncharacterized protein
MDVISSFTGEHHWLSNFSPHPVVFSGKTFPTTEHLFVWHKTDDEDERLKVFGREVWDDEHNEVVRVPLTPGQVKRLGRMLPLRREWDDMKVGVMFTCLQLKITQHPEVGLKLLGTKDTFLVEGNTWGDNFWGCTPNRGTMGGWIGNNWLGRLWMMHRQDLQRRY